MSFRGTSWSFVWEEKIIGIKEPYFEEIDSATNIGSKIVKETSKLESVLPPEFFEEIGVIEAETARFAFHTAKGVYIIADVFRLKPIEEKKTTFTNSLLLVNSS